MKSFACAAALLPFLIATAVAGDQKLEAPKGDQSCDISGWSNDTDPKGLNVRAEPSATARILGVAPPAYKFPDDTYKSEFRIVGYRDGWFQIDRIETPGKGYVETPYPRSAPQPFHGRGWVRATMVGGAYAYGGLPVGRLYDAPRENASFRKAKAKDGGEALSVGDSPKAILACSGQWGLVETDMGERGWVLSLCSNQVTNCS